MALLSSLVEIPSVNPGYEAGSTELAAQRRLAAFFAGHGLSAALWEPKAEHLRGFAESEPAARRTDWSGRPNLEVAIGEGAGGRSLLLNSHIDVVDAGPVEGWSSPAFKPEVRDGRMYGRGVMDAKGPLCAMAAAVAVVHRLAVPLSGRVLLHSVVDEEQGGGGTLAAIGRGLQADGAIVGEGTRLVTCAATRSSRRLRLHVRGRSAHPGEAFKGVNAARKAHLYVEALYGLAARLDRERPHPLWNGLPEQHVFNLNGLQAGRIGGAGAVPDRCTFEMAIGGTAAETLDELEEEVDAAIAATTASDPWLRDNPPVVEWQPQRLHPSSTDASHPLVRACAAAVEEAAGGPRGIAAISGVTDMRHLVRYGGIPTVTLGPGDLGQAHGPDESLDLAEYLAAVRAYAMAIVSFCA